MKLNGWQRAGVVATVLWALIGGFLFWRDGRAPQENLFRANYARCIDFGLKMTDTERERCSEAAERAFHAELSATTKEFWQFVPFVIAIPALIVWGLISLAIVTLRWVRKGFAASPLPARNGRRKQ